MEKTTLTPEEFLKITTEGYPIVLNHEQKVFFKIFADFVNESKENSFFAEAFEDCAKIHAGMKTEVCKITYEYDRIIINSFIDSSEYSSTGEFDSDEEHRILGYACLGVIFFCDLYLLGTGQNKKAKLRNDISREKETSGSSYNPWPV
jgi:hypothetical protein